MTTPVSHFPSLISLSPSLIVTPPHPSPPQSSRSCPSQTAHGHGDPSPSPSRPTEASPGGQRLAPLLPGPCFWAQTPAAALPDRLSPAKFSSAARVNMPKKSPGEASRLLPAGCTDPPGARVTSCIIKASRSGRAVGSWDEPTFPCPLVQGPPVLALHPLSASLTVAKHTGNGGWQAAAAGSDPAGPPPLRRGLLGVPPRPGQQVSSPDWVSLPCPVTLQTR